ncbi:histidine phosphatase family protein [Candidatus Woesearchaeota archaeon]|nr:histidine phosphatase family protein [Candidatus Woesearchaeota archaeon]
MIVYLVRHAQTRANLGGTEQTVTPEGLKQIERVAKALPAVETVYSSDQHRALITAESIAKVNKVPVIQNPDLQEIYACIVGGTTENPAPKRMKNDKRRAKKAFKFIKELKQKNVAIVCHGNIIRFFMAQVAGLPLQNMWSFDVRNCSITTLRVTGDVVDILNVNDTTHL